MLGVTVDQCCCCCCWDRAVVEDVMEVPAPPQQLLYSPSLIPTERASSRLRVLSVLRLLMLRTVTPLQGNRHGMNIIL